MQEGEGPSPPPLPRLLAPPLVPAPPLVLRDRSAVPQHELMFLEMLEEHIPAAAPELKWEQANETLASINDVRFQGVPQETRCASLCCDAVAWYLCTPFDISRYAT